MFLTKKLEGGVSPELQKVSLIYNPDFINIMSFLCQMY
ncbi:Uncharacterised protein [Legionella pneumophila subsp. pascullei]|uniref:Uncharacterized protein n=1 Tax=Legionella pneumophila subsp. pascullei TaxID=91890 RepID=A0AAX2IUX4_LEGPN|nr:Uncharacterised protein [Legionella pneumophila subsp. pascullei]VEH04168.1 Uncharacterised protein [Legionella pneumophila subsp. pascullei]